MPALRRLRVWKHFEACQRRSSGVLETLRSATAGSAGLDNLAQALCVAIPQPPWPSGCFERAQGLPGLLVNFIDFEHLRAQGAPGAAGGAAEYQKGPVLIPTNDSARTG